MILGSYSQPVRVDNVLDISMKTEPSDYASSWFIGPNIFPSLIYSWSWVATKKIRSGKKKIVKSPVCDKQLLL